MPGIFGTLRASAHSGEVLERKFRAAWPDTQVQRGEGALIGGHAFENKVAVRALNGGALLGWDGEWSLYREAIAKDEHLPRKTGGTLDPQIASAGNVVLIEPGLRRASLAADPSGTFPLYYGVLSDGFLFSSLLRPLALVMAAERDDYGTLEFLRQAYTVDGKTVFRGIRRVLPGQTITFEAGRVRTSERSRAWVGQAELGRAEAASEAWRRLGEALGRGIPSRSAALMMSGGWDSRTLLGKMTAEGIHTTCYTHGDTSSRELRIVEALSASAGTRCIRQAVDSRVLDPELLRTGFERTENVVFPHWHRAGSLLTAEGLECVAAGVFGEILGGHYGPAMLSSPAGKVRSIAGSLLGLSSPDSAAGGATASDFLRIRGLGRHWYLKPDYEASLPLLKERLNSDIDAAIGRLRRRGVTGEVALVEAFVSEHRGAQYINAQLLSCRAAMDVALPFAGEELFTFSTQVPLQAKIHNLLNRQMLNVYAPRLLRYPMAATLVPADWPVLLQEASRLVRKGYERGRLYLHHRTGGRVERPHLGWVNFDFLRDGRALHRLVDELRCGLWDRDALRHRIQSLTVLDRVRRVHPIFDQLMKIYTVDGLLKPHHHDV